MWKENVRFVASTLYLSFISNFLSALSDLLIEMGSSYYAELLVY